MMVWRWRPRCSSKHY